MDSPDISRIDLAGISSYPPGSSFGPHTTQTHELVWIEEGSARASCDHHQVVLGPGSVLLSPQGARTHYLWDERVTTRHGYVLFRASSVQTPLSVELPGGDVVPALLRHLVHLEHSRPEDWQQAAQQVLAVALRALSVPRQSAERLLSSVVLASLSAVVLRWPRPGPWPAVPLADLAAAAAVTPEHLCRAWTKDVGLSPVAALRVVRLYRSTFLLSRSNLTIGEVAALAGFDNPFHFSRAFKSLFGHSPTVFRQAGLPPPEVAAGLRAVMSHLTVSEMQTARLSR